MKAVVIGAAGIELREVKRPDPGPEQVLVRVRAVGLNRADLIMASGRMHGSAGGPGTILGLECSGEVAAVGTAVTGIKPGDRIMCSAPNTYAEYAIADMGRVHAIPANNMTFTQAATLPVALQTMHNAIVTAGRLKAGESIMIQGASSGVGLAGLQIAKVIGAGLVVGSSTNPERRAKLPEFGADLVVDSRDARWPDQVLEATGSKGVDLIVDQISGYVVNDNMRAAAVRGRIVNVGRLGGFKGDFDFDLHAMRRIDYIGVTFRTRSVPEVREINRLMRNDLWRHVEAGRIALPIDRIFTLDNAAEALAHMRANAHLGKIVLEVLG
jgi:NADPH:quinone reductase